MKVPNVLRILAFDDDMISRSTNNNKILLTEQRKILMSKHIQFPFKKFLKGNIGELPSALEQCTYRIACGYKICNY